MDFTTGSALLFSEVLTSILLSMRIVVMIMTKTWLGKDVLKNLNKAGTILEQWNLGNFKKSSEIILLKCSKNKYIWKIYGR